MEKRKLTDEQMTVHYKNRMHFHLTTLVDGGMHQNFMGFLIKNSQM